MSVDLTTDATIDANASISITVHEDTNQDGASDNSETQSIDNGTNTYTLTTLNGGTGNDYWFDSSQDQTDDTSIAKLNSVKLET